MEVVLHSPNIASSFPPAKKLHNSRLPPSRRSNPSDPNKFISEANTKNSSVRVCYSITKQNFNVPLINSSLVPSKSNLAFHKSPLSRIRVPAATISADTLSSSTSHSSSENVHWLVIVDSFLEGAKSKADIINYYVSILQRALGSEEDAQSRIYDASCDTHLGFCCNIDEETSRVLAGLPGVLAVKPDPDINSVVKDYSTVNLEANFVSKSLNGNALLFPEGSKDWLVRVDKPSVRISSKAQAVDFYVSLLTKVLGNEKDAQMCIYHISWQSNFGFCCKLDEESAQDLAAVPGVLTVEPDECFESENKDYRGNRLSPDAPDSTQTTEMSKTKLFITGLSFYTSEKTLRAAFEPFGELVEVKVIMDKISKRSKGYAFVEYTTEEAATTALKEMNGKIINGWMIVVDRAKIKSRYSRNSSRSLSSQDR